MKVSIIMPARNPGVYFAEAIESVLAQDHRNIELVILDDGSTDGSRQLAESYCSDPRVKVLDGPRSGIAACLNRGIESSSGDILMRCDADDIYPEGRISRQVHWLIEHPRHAAVCGTFSTIDRQGDLIAHLWRGGNEEVIDISAEMRGAHARLRTHLGAFAIRREHALRAGLFRTYFETAEDIDFALRLAETGPIGFQPVNSYFYRLHSASITHTQADQRRVFFEQTAYQFAGEREARGRDSLAAGQPPSAPATKTDGTSRMSRLRTANQMRAMLVGRAWNELSKGNKGIALQQAVKAIGVMPLSMKSWRCLVMVCVKCVFSR